MELFILLQITEPGNPPYLVLLCLPTKREFVNSNDNIACNMYYAVATCSR